MFRWIGCEVQMSGRNEILIENALHECCVEVLVEDVDVSLTACVNAYAMRYAIDRVVLYAYEE